MSELATQVARMGKWVGCPCKPPSWGCNECCTILHDYQHGDWCEKCNGTGKVWEYVLSEKLREEKSKGDA